MTSNPSSPHDSASLLATLNTEQRAAVTLPAEHALILAGAGSGKTRVLTTRIAWLLQNGQASSSSVLAVTFTNKAAREMVARLSGMLPLNVHGMWIGTFHGLCNRMLRAHHRAINLPESFQILDTQDQLSAIKRLCKQFNIDTERYEPKKLAWFISGCKEDGLRPQMVPVKLHDNETRKKVEIYQLYEEQCQREGVVDFGELMLRSYELLRDHDPVREHYQRRFRHILVDEFQDTNKLQYAWIKMLAGQGENASPDTPGAAVLAVGDDDQSIYAFRGARVGNMADFVREFKVPPQNQIKLEQNYRSFGNILDSANALISHNAQRLGKNLRTEQGQGEPVRVREAVSDFYEAQWLVEEIQSLVREGLARHEIAVLYRSNAQSRVLESALFNARIPYRVYGGLRFFERAEVKHALAYLRLLENPNDDTSFLRVVNFPARGIGTRSLEQLQDLARTTGCSLHDAVSALGGRAGATIAGFVAKIDVLREQASGKILRDIVALMLEHSGLVAHYKAEREGAERLENLDELINAAESFVMQSGFGRNATTGVGETGETMSPLAAFLTHAALEAGDNMAQAGQDAIQLMTVHAAKGLEFDCVFITGLEDGMFPNEMALSTHDGLEEERRLMYVAITRARQRLYLSLAQSRMLHGQTRLNTKSRFLDELPEECLKWLTPKRKASDNAMHSIATPARPTSDTGSFGQNVVNQSSAGSAHGLRLGQKVFHAKFGEGTVLTLEGKGDDARAHIRFSQHGPKWLALSVAKLTPVP